MDLGAPVKSHKASVEKEKPKRGKKGQEQDMKTRGMEYWNVALGSDPGATHLPIISPPGNKGECRAALKHA